MTENERERGRHRRMTWERVEDGTNRPCSAAGQMQGKCWKKHMQKRQPLSVSDNTVHRRIAEMSVDMRLKVLWTIKAMSSELFTIHVDKSTEVLCRRISWCSSDTFMKTP